MKEKESLKAIEKEVVARIHIERTTKQLTIISFFLIICLLVFWAGVSYNYINSYDGKSMTVAIICCMALIILSFIFLPFGRTPKELFDKILQETVAKRIERKRQLIRESKKNIIEIEKELSILEKIEKNE